MISTPWAILLCKFNDNNSEPHPRKFYEDLFTSSGTGTQNMVDFFRDMSHGTLDLSGTQIFPTKEIGWYTVDESFKNYRPRSVAGEIGLRWKLVNWAKEAATRYHPDWPKVDISKFYGVVAVYNIGNVDLGGAIGPDPGHRGHDVVCDEFSVKPCALGHEMGHGYGLEHSRSDLIAMDDKDADYKDAWDIMSTFATFRASHPVYDSIYNPDPRMNDIGYSIGPGLNAAAMDNQGWLDKSRVRKITYGVETVDLRPLHQLDLHDGYLAISVDKYFIEFRMNDGWDAAFPAPVVLVHYFEEWMVGNSYLMGLWDWKTRRALPTPYGPGVLTKKGDKFEIKLDYHLKIELENIDVTQRIARISIDYSPIPPDWYYGIWPWEYRSPAIPLTRLRPAKDIVIVNEKIIQTPQWSLRPILKSLADISSSEQFNSEDIRRTIRQEALETIIRIADEALNEMNFPKGLAPPRDLGGQSQQST